MTPGQIPDEVADHQVRRLIAGAVAAERARLANRQQVIAEVKAELDDAFQFTERDGSRHGYVTRAWVESLLAHHAASAVAAERERMAGEVNLLAAEFVRPADAVGTLQYLAQRVSFPAIREALKGAADLIREGLPDLESTDG